jgi:hypothetical protein
MLQQGAEQPDADPGEGAKKSFDCMGREQPFRSRLNGGCVSLIFFQGIELNQVTAGAIHQEAKQLLEDLRHRLALGAFADGAEKAFQDRINGDVAKIADKKGQPASGGKGVRGCFNSIDNLAFFISNSHSSACDNLPPIGFV